MHHSLQSFPSFDFLLAFLLVGLLLYSLNLEGKMEFHQIFLGALLACSFPLLSPNCIKKQLFDKEFMRILFSHDLFRLEVYQPKLNQVCLEPYLIIIQYLFFH